MSAVLNTLQCFGPAAAWTRVALGLDRHNCVESALMKGYIGLGDRDGFRIVFDEVAVKNVVVCNVLLLGYVEFGLIGEAKMVFDSMTMSEASEVFDCLPEKDVDHVVSWNSMITGCEKFVEALDIFVHMMSSGTCSPNGCTFSSALHACSGCSSLVTVNQLHACLLKFGIPLEVFLGNSLIDMYAKSGDVDAAFRVFFESMTTKNLVSWSSIICGYARHGPADRALEEFQKMIMSDTLPDGITFVNVLSACASGGKVKEVEAIVNSMEGEYGVQAELEHYSCMVNLYGRAGQLEKAKTVIKTMSFEPNEAVWCALLGTCGQHSSLEVGEFAAMGLSKLNPDHRALYENMSKIYAKNAGNGGRRLYQL